MVMLRTTDKLEKTRLADYAPKQVYAVCPYCGLRYRYNENTLYRPKSCNQYECVGRSLDPNSALRERLIREL